jgi:tetratricopeptide (TPR) repeat protein
MSDPDGAKCPRCGASLSADGSADLCPRCLLSDARGALSEDRSDSPSSPGGAHHELSRDSLIAAIGATGQQPAVADAHPYILAAAMMALREQEAGRALSDADIHYYRGIALAAQKKLGQAVAEFATALRLRPDFAEAHNDLGNALRDQGKQEEAIAAYRTAIRVKPDFAYPHYNLGLILAAEGNLAEAIAAFRAARDRAQPGPELARLIERALAESYLEADGRDRWGLLRRSHGLRLRPGAFARRRARRRRRVVATASASSRRQVRKCSG